MSFIINDEAFMDKIARYLATRPERRASIRQIARALWPEGMTVQRKSGCYSRIRQAARKSAKLELGDNEIRLTSA